MWWVILIYFVVILIFALVSFLAFNCIDAIVPFIVGIGEIIVIIGVILLVVLGCYTLAQYMILVH